jgi:DNA (cytosine-5)-methyltransferase 1
VIYGSVCSGIEAASVAWEPLGWRAQFFSEVSKTASAVLAHRFGSNMPGEALSRNGVPNYGDFTTIPADAGPIDLLVGGTPCQAFSIAGKRLGLDDPRGNLSIEFCRLAKRLGAKWIVWENVPGVLSSNGGEDFAAFISLLVECGYGIAWRVLDSQYVRIDGFPFAVPQRRRRVFVVGYIGDWRPASAVLFEPEGLRGDPAPMRKSRRETTKAFDCSTKGARGTDNSPTIDTKHAAPSRAQSGLIIMDKSENWPKDVAPTINAKFGSKLGLDNQHIFSGAGMFVSDETKPIAFNCKSSRMGIQVGDVSPTLTSMNSLTGAHNGGGQLAITQPSLRRLTPRECERLQGFPDDWTAVPNGSRVLSDGPRYHAIGNSMAVNVMRWIGQRIDIADKVLDKRNPSQ